MQNAFLFFLGPYILFVMLSGFFLYYTSLRFTEVTPVWWAKVLLFSAMTLSSGMVIWIGDNNFAMTFPFYIAADVYKRQLAQDAVEVRETIRLPLLMSSSFAIGPSS